MTFQITDADRARINQIQAQLNELIALGQKNKQPVALVAVDYFTDLMRPHPETGEEVRNWLYHFWTDNLYGAFVVFNNDHPTMQQVVEVAAGLSRTEADQHKDHECPDGILFRESADKLEFALDYMLEKDPAQLERRAPGAEDVLIIWAMPQSEFSAWKQKPKGNMTLN